MRFIPRKIISFSLLLLVLLHASSDIARADVSCTASMSTNSVLAGTTTNITFTVNNTDLSENYIQWVRILAPANFTVNGGNAEGWSIASFSDSYIAFNDNGFGIDDPRTFTINVTAEAAASSNNTFTVEGSGEFDGSGQVSCSGSLSATITSLDISNITLADISTSDVTVTWTTSEAANSHISYGPTTAYGASKSDSSLATAHNLHLAGLSANTTYHFKIQSTNGSGVTVTTADNTFTTAKNAETITTEVTKEVTKEVIQEVVRIETKLVQDSTPPSVSVTTDFAKVYPQAPEITGTVTDDVGVASVEYSIDAGRQWAAAKIPAIGSKTAEFRFIPLGLDDGTFPIQVRGIDASGNIKISDTFNLTIDRLPPIVGPLYFRVGPQLLFPNGTGHVQAITSLDELVTLSAAGGPNTIVLTTEDVSAPENRQEFPMAKDSNTGLWSATLNFKTAGIYAISAKAIDGASNTTERTVSHVEVLDKGRLISTKAPIARAKVKAFVKNQESNSFDLWNAEPYLLANPVATDSQGAYQLILPKGTYYLEMQAAGHLTQRTEVFTLAASQPITASFALDTTPTLSIGRWSVSFPSWVGFFATQKTVAINPTTAKTRVKTGSKNILEAAFPHLIFEAESAAISSLDLRGKPSIVTFLAAWSPDVSRQLTELAALQEVEDLNVIAVLVQSTPTYATLFAARGGYTVPLYTDRDGLAVEPLALTSLPSHFILNRRAIVKGQHTGILTSEELSDALVAAR